jgi:predicted DNA-binding protein (MmcQ/YjbR family)
MAAALTRSGLKKLAATWPGTTTDVKWGNDLMFSVGGKIFAGIANDREAVKEISFKVPDDQFLELTDQPGIVPAPYAARFKWVMVREPERYGRKWLENAVRTSYELVKAKLPKKVRDALA